MMFFHSISKDWIFRSAATAERASSIFHLTYHQIWSNCGFQLLLLVAWQFRFMWTALQQHAPDHQKHLGKTESVASIRPMCLPACVRAYEISLSFSPMMMRTLLATREQQNQLISRAHASTFNLRARARTNGRTDERTVLRAINGR